MQVLIAPARWPVSVMVNVVRCPVLALCTNCSASALAYGLGTVVFRWISKSCSSVVTQSISPASGSPITRRRLESLTVSSLPFVATVAGGRGHRHVGITL
ncbi:hypothetical protein [Streptomyces sp. NPDC041003]|uniref:hypothetical protein n=1 Tax=Streptomyces sp. NPDC041003 TaxID=3155730 RepID=UPI0033E33196